MPHRLARALCDEKALPIKELFESFEVFERVRRRLRAAVVADLCCGHGLTGALFAIFARDTEQVILLDHKRPQSHAHVMRAIERVAPWAPAKVRYVEARVQRAREHVPDGASVVALHACGSRTDRCIDLAVERRGALALVPCCYFGTAQAAPPALREALGPRLATDVHRTYRLEQAGFRVEWSAIPRAVTAMNRVLVARPREEKRADKKRAT
ncbi:MAG: methyltransferase [Myxococcales bacterium]|nr:methyltransferase [Myxococcales bacterium]